MRSSVMRGGLLGLAVAVLCGLPAAAAIPAGNLIGDPGAETGAAADDATHVFAPPNPPWFSAFGGETQVHYTATGGFPGPSVSNAIGGATAFFAGGPASPENGNSRQIDLQTINLSPYATDIDRGQVRADLSGFLGGFGAEGDSAKVTVSFTDTGGDNTFLSLSIGPVTASDRNNVTNLLARAVSGTVPALTREARVTVDFTRTSGVNSYNDGYADNLSLTLVDHTPPVVHTTGVDGVTQSAATVHGTIDDTGRQLGYHFDYGTSTAYGQSTASQTSAGTTGTNPVQASLGGLTPGNDYHARLVVDGPDGPVPGEDVTFHTGGIDPNAPGLPAGLDFTWSPRADVQIAGAPAGGLQFQATPGPGVTYAWDFDYHDGAGFVSDQAASGAAPRHGFTADGAHDASKIAGADGQRRRVYAVRLRATAANGTSADVTHQLVVAPDNAPKVDFVTQGAGGPVSGLVTFTPQVSDPDQTSRTADSIDHLEWNFDTAINGQSAVDLICNGDGTNCRLPDGTAPGPWFAAASNGGAQVDFWRRALAFHGLNPLGDLNLNALPTTLPTGAPLVGGLGVLNWAKSPFYVEHDPRLAYLYENATLLMQSSFNKDAGEATGAKYSGHAPIARSVQIAQPVINHNHYFDSAFLTYRQVTLTAVDSAGVRTSVTHAVPLRPDAPPQLSARFVNASADGSTKPIAVVPPRTRHGKQAPSGQPLSQILTQPLTVADQLVFDASATRDPDGQIAYYTLEVGTPFSEPGTCTPGKPFMVGPSGAISLDAPDVNYLPGQFFPGTGSGGTGPGIPPGVVGSLNVPAAANVKALQKTSFRAINNLPPLGQLLGTPYLHPCPAYTARNVIPGPFKALPGPDVRPAARATGFVGQPINPGLLRPIAGVEYDTSAIVTSDPSQLRFRIPKEGTYSVAVGAYDKEGQGAVQRTDGFVIQSAKGTCSKVSGAVVTLAGHNLGFSGLCIDFGSSRRYYWSSKEIDVDGVELMPEQHSAIFVDTCKGAPTSTGPHRASRRAQCTPRVFATGANKPDLSKPVDVNALAANEGAVAVLVDGDAVARFAKLTPAAMANWITGQGGSQPVVPPGATYKGSPVSPAAHSGPDATTFNVTFGQPEGSSETTFSVVMPTAFSIDPKVAPPTKEVTRHGFDEPRTTALTTNKFADIASRRAHSRAVAHAAALALKGTLDFSGLVLGPVHINSGSATFDPSAGYFDLNISDADIWLPNPNPATLHIRIENGDLKEAGGSAGATVPIFPGVFLTQLRFNIVTDPLTLKGGAGFTALEILTGNVDLTVRPEPLLLRLDGSIGVAGITLGNAFVQYDEAQHSTLTFGGHFGYDFGPVSAAADLRGGISGTGDFYIEGKGHACLGFCLGVDALVSNIAVAACGTIDLAITSVSAGFAFTFAGPSLDVFTGCDLSGYIPAVFKTRDGPSLRAPRAVGTLTVAPNTQQAAFRFTAVPGSAGTPVVTMTAPTGQQFATTATPGDYAFSPPGPVGVTGGGLTKAPSALVDEDPVDHVTTFLVANPPAGDWKVSVDPSGPVVATADVATGRHLPDATLQAKVETAALPSGGGVRIGSQSFAAGTTTARTAASRARRPKIAPAIVRALAKLPSLEDKRLRGVVLNVPAGLDGKLTLLDAGPNGVNVVRTITLTKAGGKVPIAFDPSAGGGTHTLRAFITHADGTPRQVINVGSFSGPPMPTPSRPGLKLHRVNGTVVLDVRPGTAGLLSGPITRFELIASTSAGQRIQRLVDISGARRLAHGRFRVNLGRFAGNVSVKTTGRMLYGDYAGTSAGDVLRGR